MRRSVAILVTAWLLTFDPVYGQEPTEPPSQKELAVAGVLMLPAGDWIHPDTSIAAGGAFHALFPVASSRVSAGFDCQLLFYEEGTSGEQLITAHGLLRAHLSRGARHLYVETLAGIMGFSVDPDHPGAFNYGAGIGVQFPKATRPPYGLNEQEFFEIGVRYLQGGGVRLAAGRFASSTHALMVSFGWGFRRR